MRLWTVHPKYLDPQGLVALWREALLAREVLRGRTRGYRFHPQLERFRASAAPLSAINAYLAAVHAEALRRGYAFDRSKLSRARTRVSIPATDAQVQYEWRRLLAKLRVRSRTLHRRQRHIAMPEVHPLFHLVVGPIESWERGVAPQGNVA